MKAECREEEKFVEKEASLVAEEWDSNNVFMVSSDAVEAKNSVWLVDSGCSNHMTGKRIYSPNLMSLRRFLSIWEMTRRLRCVELEPSSLAQGMVSSNSYMECNLFRGLLTTYLALGSFSQGGYLVIFKENKCVISDDRTKEKLLKYRGRATTCSH